MYKLTSMFIIDNVHIINVIMITTYSLTFLPIFKQELWASGNNLGNKQ